MMFEVGDRVQIDLPDHWTHGSSGRLAERQIWNPLSANWFWVHLDGELDPRMYRAEYLIPLDESVNPTDFETATGALAR